MATRTSGYNSSLRSHVDEIDTYVDLQWCLNSNFTLYVHFAGAVHDSSTVGVTRFLRVGKVSKCTFSKVWKTPDGKVSHVFKFRVPPQENDDSQDVDAAFRVYVVKQKNFHDFSEHSHKWLTNKHVQKSYIEFMDSPNGKGKGNGVWLKSVFATEMLDTQNLNDSGIFDGKSPSEKKADLDEAPTTPTKPSNPQAPGLNLSFESPPPNQRIPNPASSKRAAVGGVGASAKRKKHNHAATSQDLLMSQIPGMRTFVIGGERG
jgi:hypothetical protein